MIGQLSTLVLPLKNPYSPNDQPKQMVSQEQDVTGEKSSNLEKTNRSPERDGQGNVTQSASSDELLSSQEKQLLSQLKVADKKVKAHEMAHLIAAGSYARGRASFKYRTGPDGEKYAIAGEVAIDVQKESSPEKTIEKMKTVRRAALAPAEPSSQDRQVAAQATRTIAEVSQALQVDEAAHRAQQSGGKTDSTDWDQKSQEAPVGVNLYV